MLLFSLTGTSVEDGKENNLSSREKKRTAFPGLCIPDETKGKRDVSSISRACVICNAFFIKFRTQKGAHSARRSLQRPLKLGLRIIV